MYFATSQLQPWSSRDMQRGQGGKKNRKDQAIYFVISKSKEFLVPAPTAKNSHFSVFDGYYFSCARNRQLPESSFPIGLAHCLLPDWLHQALLGSHGAWHKCSVQNTSFCSSTLAPCSSSSLVWCVCVGGRGQRLETYKLSCSFGGNSPSRNSFSKEKKKFENSF